MSEALSNLVVGLLGVLTGELLLATAEGTRCRAAVGVDFALNGDSSHDITCGEWIADCVAGGALVHLLASVLLL